MNLDSKSWVVGKDYSAAPTCATCHMSATRDQKITHDVGDRISYTLRPVVSFKLENWEKRRAAMQDVCSSCHATGWVENFYKQYEGTVDLYNEKFAKPAKAIMEKLYASGKLTKTPFDEKIEWTYYELWHHQGPACPHGHRHDGSGLHPVARLL
jgi:hydroxylamine dehydrogenase